MEVVVTLVVAAVVLAACTWGVGARRRAPGATTAPRDTTPGRAMPGTWTASQPLETAFPVERTPHERAIGDAAFVDGLIVGRYVFPHDDRAVAADDHRPAGGFGAGLDEGSDDGFDDGSVDGFDDGSVDGFDVDDGFGDGVDDGFGDGPVDGFDDGVDDGFDDDW